MVHPLTPFYMQVNSLILYAAPDFICNLIAEEK